MTKESKKDIFISVTGSAGIGAMEWTPGTDTIILIRKEGRSRTVRTCCSAQETGPALMELLAGGNIRDILFIAGEDHFDPEQLRTAVDYIYREQVHTYVTLLLPYLAPPLYDFRTDGHVSSFIIAAAAFDETFLEQQVFSRLAFTIVHKYLNTNPATGLQVYQVGKPGKESRGSNRAISALLERSLLVLPHKGVVNLLKRSLSCLEDTAERPGTVNLCFDDNSCNGIALQDYEKLRKSMVLYRNRPGNVGPYLARHYSAISTDCEYIFLQDTDDISMNNRFWKQLHEMKRRDLDLVGSHALTVDEFLKVITIVRYPLDVNRSLAAENPHSLLHPTTLIKKEAYLRAKGYSTDLKFGYDTQFLMRAYFYMKIGNVDDFLYLKFRRPNSLTVKKSTTPLRTFLNWRRRVDFRLVLAGQLDLEDSSLSCRKHGFDYQMLRIDGASNPAGKSATVREWTAGDRI